MKSTIENAQARKYNLIEYIKRETEDLKTRLTKRVENMTEGEIISITEFITQKKAASILGVSVPSLRKYTKMGEFKQHRMGTKVYYREDEIYDKFK